MLLSFLAIGGTPTVLPEMQRYVVEVQHWLTSQPFAAAFTLAQVAPGPPIMYVTLIGWQIAGWAGAAATTLAVLIPAGTLTLLVGHLHARHPKARLIRVFRHGLTPMTIGLLLASAWIMIHTANHSWGAYLLTRLAVVVALRTTWHPLWLIAAGALAGLV